MKNILLIIVIFFYSNLITAQSVESIGHIQGSVIDAETKSPLVGVNIFIKEFQIGTTTDLEGKYILNNVPVGLVSLSISYIGYESITKTDISVKPNKTVFSDIEMSASIIEMKEVVITNGYFSELENKPVSTTNFSSEEIRRSPGTAGDVSRILFTLPSVAKVNDQRNSLIVRGGTAVENSFYLDNIEIPNINHFPVEGSSDGPIGILNADFIENVNFYSGNFSPIYGDRLSSIMEIGYREGNKTEFTPKIQLNMAGVGGAIEGPIGNSGNYLFSFSRSYLDLILQQIEEGAPLPKYGDVQGKLNYNLDDKNRLTFLNVLSIDQIDMNQKKAIDNDANIYGTTNGTTNTVGINWRRIWGESGYSNTSLSHTYTKFDRNYNNTVTLSEFYKNQTLENMVKIRNLNYLKLDNMNSIEFGIELQGIFTDYDTYYGEYKDQFGNITPPLNVDGRADGYKYGFFGVHHWNLFDDLRLDYGARLDFFSYNDNLNISPRASLSYHIDSKTVLSLSAGIFHQNIPNNVLAQSNDFKSLNTPKAIHYTFSFSRQILDATRLSVEVYYKDYYNFPMNPTQPTLFLFDQVQVYGLFWSQQALEDNGRAISKGIEIILQKKLAKDFYGMISGSISNTRYKDYYGDWYNRIYDNQFNFNVEGGYIPANDWEFKVRWVYAGGAPYTPFDIEASQSAGVGIWDLNKTNSVRLPDYHSLNLRVDKRFYFDNSSLLVYLSIWNVYNRENIAFYYWNEITNQMDSQTQWSTLPVLGIEYEF